MRASLIIALTVGLLSVASCGEGDEVKLPISTVTWPDEIKDGPALSWSIHDHPRVESEIFVVNHTDKGFKAVYETVQQGVPQRVSIPFETERLLQLNEDLKKRNLCQKLKDDTLNAEVKSGKPTAQDIATANASATMVLNLPDHRCTLGAPLSDWRRGDLVWLDGMVRNLHRRGSILTL